MKPHLNTDDNSTLADAAAPILGPPTIGEPEALYLQEPGTTNAVSIADVNQGSLGDCYLLSSIDTFIRQSPTFITNMIHDNGNGTQTVRLYEDASTNAPASLATRYFKPVYETVNDAALDPYGTVDSGPGQDMVNGVKEIWPQVVEQAYGQLNGGLANLTGGDAAVAMATMSGISGQNPKAAVGNLGANVISAPALNLSMLQRLINDKCTITFDTMGFGQLADGLIDNHCYAYVGCNVAGPGGSATTINLANPWGPAYGTTVVAMKDVAANFSDIQVGHATN